MSRLRRRRHGSNLPADPRLGNLALQISQVTETLGVTRCTAYSITRRFLSTGEVARVPVAGGRPPKLDQESVDFLQMLMKANPCTTLREMNATLREIFSRKPQITTSTIFRALEGELITLKQANNVLWK